MPVDSRPATVCIPYGDVNRRQYSIGATAGLPVPDAVPVDVAAANMSGDTNEDSVNGGYAWVLTASSTIYLVNISPSSRQIKAVVRKSQTQLFPLTPEDPSEGFVYKNDASTSAPGRRTAAVPEPAARPQRDELHGVAGSDHWGPRASTCRRCSSRPGRTSNRCGRREPRTTRRRWTTGRARRTCSSPIATPPSRRGGTSPGRGRSSARATRAS